MLIWRLVILLKYFPGKAGVLHARNEQNQKEKSKRSKR